MTAPGQPLSLDRARLDALLGAACDRLEGDWLLVGGALVALWLDPRRVTADLDLIGLRGLPQERYALVDFAAGQGLPIETVNSAADYFVHRIDGWSEQVEPFRAGARMRIFRPTPTLFLLLKIGRLSPQDLEDCLTLIGRATADGLPIDRSRVCGGIDRLPPTADAALGERRARLRAALGA